MNDVLVVGKTSDDLQNAFATNDDALKKRYLQQVLSWLNKCSKIDW